MFKCPKCKTKFEKKYDLLNHMITDCNYSYWVAMEICEDQEKKLQ